MLIATSMQNSNGPQVQDVEGNSPVEGFPVPQIAAAVARKGVRNLSMKVNCPLAPVKQSGGLAIVSGPSFERTPTSGNHGQSAAANSFLEFSFRRLGSVEIAPGYKSSSHSAGKANGATTQSQKSSVKLVPTGMVFATKSLAEVWNNGESTNAPRSGVT